MHSKGLKFMFSFSTGVSPLGTRIKQIHYNC